MTKEIKEVKKQLENLYYLKNKICNIEAQIKKKKGTTHLYITDELQQQLQKELNKNKKQQTVLLIMVSQLDALSYNLIIDRFVKHRSLKRITWDYHLSERQILRLYDKAYEKIKELKKDVSKCQ